ncbi:MAG: glycosyltransferase [Patescibacteria group bacterium]
MRIAIFSNTYLPRLSGPSISISQTVAWLRRHGHTAQLIVPEYSSVFSSRPREAGVTRVSAFRLFSFGSFAIPLPVGSMVVRRVLDRLRPDVVHIHQPFLLGTVGMQEACRRNLPLVYTFHTMYHVYAGYLGFAKFWMQEQMKRQSIRVCQAADRVIVPTRAIQGVLEGGGVKTPIKIIPTGIQLHRYLSHPSAQALCAVRQSLRIGQKQPMLLYVGRMGKEKNVRLVCEAIVRIRRIRPEVVTVFIGSGTEERRLRVFFEKHGCQDVVRWMGIQSQSALPSYYHAADLFVFPSTSDTQAIVLYEALAAGLPIVAVDSMAAREAIEAEKNGLITGLTSRAFSDGIMEGLRRKSRLHARLDPRAYAADVIAERHLKLYQSFYSGG